MSLPQSTAWMRSRRFWLIAVAILLVNNVAWLAYHLHQPSLHLLRVERFDPGHGSLEAKSRPQLTWRFNLAIADRRVDQPPVLVKPALAGKYTWDDDRTLRFVPAEPLPVATQWDFVVPQDRIKSVEGCTLAADFRQSCQTASLALESVRQTNFSNQTVSLELKFNDLVLPSDLGSRLKVLGNEGRPLPVTVRDGKPSNTVTAIVSDVTPVAKDVNLTVVVRQGLAAHTGLLGLAHDVSQTVLVTTELVLNEIHPQAGPNGCVIALNRSRSRRRAPRPRRRCRLSHT